MLIDKNYPGLIVRKQGPYKAYILMGNIHTPEDLTVTLDGILTVTGSIVVGKDIAAPFGLYATGEIIAGKSIAVADKILTSREKYIHANGPIFSKGQIEVKEYIKSGEYIECGEAIISDGHIIAKQSILAYKGIYAGTYIDCGKRIFAGIDPKASSKNCLCGIECAELRRGEVAYGNLILTKPE